jgi:putative Ca2+/H+ antiporter (TMEM165/GDT1 family)
LIGVFIATVLNHALAVAVGNLLTHFQAIHNLIDSTAALSFILFGLWTLKGDRLEGEDKKKYPYGPIVTVTIAFFLAEIGDKTQLATIALAARFPENPVYVLLGTTTGMIFADGIGILVSVVLCRQIPEKTVKIISAFIFILFGFVASFRVLKENFALGQGLIILVMGIVAVLTIISSILLIRKNFNRNAYAGSDKTCETPEPKE